MKCSQCQLIIDNAGDIDRLPVEAARHVADCVPCGKFGAELIALRSLLREPGRIAAPDDYDLSLGRRLRAAKAAPPSRLALVWSLRPQASMAAAVAFLFVCSGALVVSRYSISTESNPESIATNRPYVSESGAPTTTTRPVDVVAAVPETGGLVAVATVTRDGGRSSRPVGRVRPSVHAGDSGDAMLLVSDDQGSRLVDVPSVLVGSEMIVPVAAGDGDASETVSF